MQSHCDIIIIGGGIIGLATAIELRLLGAKVTIIQEQTPSNRAQKQRPDERVGFASALADTAS